MRVQAGAQKVCCGGAAHAARGKRPTLARYARSESDGVWERIDRHGSDDDWYITTSLTAYPRPKFKCPCGHSPVFTHEQIQAALQQAASEGRPLYV